MYPPIIYHHLPLVFAVVVFVVIVVLSGGAAFLQVLPRPHALGARTDRKGKTKTNTHMMYRG